MRTFDQLNETEKTFALKKATDNLLGAICERRVCFDDKSNGDNLQARIDAAINKADKMQTPWFAGSYIMDTCREEIESMARADAEDCQYAEKNEIVPKVVRLA